MANVLALHSVGNSIVTYLRNSYPQQVAGITMPACSFDLMSFAQLASNTEEATTRITLLLYRVTVDEHARQIRASNRVTDGPAPLSLDEQLTFAWTLRQMHEHPVLDASALSPEAGWTPDEVIQIVPAELTTEDMMRVWDGFEASYRLSSTYIARLVRLDPDQAIDTRRVVARQLALGAEA